MARKTKRTKTRKIRRNGRIREKKTNKNYFYLAIIALIAIVLVVVFYFGSLPNQPSYQPQGGNQISTPEAPSTKTNIVTGGSCNKDSECFITSCKGQTEDCVNTTQLTFYSKKCNSYSDWVVGRKDISRCSCVGNACTMK